MSEAIEPGDLVRVIRSHCPAAWAEEQGTYFVAGPVLKLGRMGLECGVCGETFARGEVVADWPDSDGTNVDSYAFPAAWLRKVPGLTADEVCEELSHLLEVV